jgi:hypothetical protein
MDWELTERGTWIAADHVWAYELVRNPNSAYELWNVRVWMTHDPRKSRIIGGYADVERAKFYTDRDAKNPNVYYKTNWFQLLREDR